MARAAEAIKAHEESLRKALHHRRRIERLDQEAQAYIDRNKIVSELTLGGRTLYLREDFIASPIIKHVSDKVNG